MASTSSSSAMTQTLLRTPETKAQTPIQKNNKAYPKFTPMHDVRPVPKGSHHVSSEAAVASMNFSDSAIDACRPNVLMGTDTDPNMAYTDEDVESLASASWVGRKVDAIFSPVLNFLHGATNGVSTDEGHKDPSQALPLNLEEELASMTPSEKSHEDEGMASTIMHEALCQVRSDLRKFENKGCIENEQYQPDTHDGNSSMVKVVSTESPALDLDGDVTMADNFKLQNCQSGVCGSVSLEPYEFQHSVSNPRNSDQDYDDGEEEFNPYLFIKCLPPYKLAIPPGWASRPKALPPLDYAIPHNIPPICLVLDLDETLVHCTVEPVADADMIFPVEFNGAEYQVHVRCRPFLNEFLEAVSRKFEVVIFTASQQVYADKLLDKIDPEGKFIRHRMFRDSCLHVEGNFLKDLTILGRDLSKAVLVDNSPHAFGYQVDNGIPIESWFDDPDDKELLKLEMFLRSLHGVDDVRVVVRKTFHTHQLVLNA